MEWNGSALPTNYKNSTLLTASVTAADIQSVGTASVSVSNPLPGGGISGALKLQMNLSSTTGVVAVNLLANDLVWDPVRQQFYLSLPSADGSTGNAVQVMHMDGSLGANVFAGSEPHLLSMSANGQNLYVSLDGSSSVLQMALPNLTVSNAIALGLDPLWGPYFAMDVEASPVADGTAAVVRGEVNLDPMEEGGVVIYDNGVARPDALCGFAQDGCNSDAGLLDSIQWNSDGTEMYAANYEDTGFNFYTVPVTHRDSARRQVIPATLIRSTVPSTTMRPPNWYTTTTAQSSILPMVRLSGRSRHRGSWCRTANWGLRISSDSTKVKRAAAVTPLCHI